MDNPYSAYHLSIPGIPAPVYNSMKSFSPDIHNTPSLEIVFVVESYPDEDALTEGGENVKFVVCGDTEVNPKGGCQ